MSDRTADEVMTDWRLSRADHDPYDELGILVGEVRRLRGDLERTQTELAETTKQREKWRDLYEGKCRAFDEAHVHVDQIDRYWQIEHARLVAAEQALTDAKAEHAEQVESVAPLIRRMQAAEQRVNELIPAKELAELRAERAEQANTTAAQNIRAEKRECPEHPSPLPKPSCWQCGRNGAFERAARMVEGRAAALGVRDPEGTAHDHREYVAGCFRCDLSADEVGVRDPAEPTAEAVALTEVRDLWQRALEREGNLASAVADVMWKATPYGQTEDGDIYAYIVPKGCMHRLIGVAQSNGARVPVSFRALPGPVRDTPTEPTGADNA